MKPSSLGKSTVEARAVYDKVIEVFFFFAPVEGFDELVYPDFLGYGTAAHEFFKDREAVKQMAKLQAEQLKETKFTLTRKPVVEKFLSNGSVFLILEDFELYMEDNDHVVPLRLSTILEKISGKWMVTHFHGSTPDANIDEEEALPMEGLRKKNEELEAKIRERTRELEIEATLERIRARTMAMQTTDELTDVLSLLFKQFDILGIDPAFAHLTLFNEADDTFSFRITGTSGQRIIAEQIIDMASYPAWYESYEKWKKGDPGIVDCIDYPPEAVKAVFEIMDPIFSKLPKDSEIKAENFPQGIYTTQGHCQFGYIGFNHTRRATEEEKEIVRKFAIEFGRLYRRFLDLKQAESQAREAQIEASLERVRSASMAIHNSEELHKVVLTVLQEINSLGLNIDAAHLFRFEEGDDKGLNMWIAGDGGMYPYEIYFPYIKHAIFDGIYEARVKNKNFFAIPRMSKKEKDRVYRHLLKNTKIEITEGRQNYALEAKSAAYSVALAKHSGIALLQFSEDNRGFSADENEILRRFSNVFEQAYIRFLGLAKAEKQAREAMIEASLERIRSRSMAMHASDELNDVLSVMFGQIELLGIDAKSAHLTLMDLENNKFSFRITGKSGAANIGEQIIDLDAMPTWQETVENWKKAKPHSHQCLVYPPEILPDLWNLIDESLKKLPVKERIRIEDFPNGVFDCEGHTKFGYIGFNNSRPPTEEEISIVIRFAREFERVYQRFLDIEKAEAQAREAQIEAALEKVRSKSLAMHSTSEMQLVANAVFEQLQALGMEMDVVGMSGVIEAKQDYDVWIGGAPLGSALRIPYNEDTQVQRDYNKMLKDRPELFVRTYSGQVKKEYIDRLLTHGEFPRALKKKMETSDAFTTLIAPKKNSGIQVVRYTDQPFTDQDAEILKRFAGVFEQAYIRFMDLEKAEAQAREAQIEASLERIRAKAMAMHVSSELNEVLSVLFEQFNTLGINPVWAHLSLIDLEENTFTYRMSRADKNNRLSGQVVDLDARPEWQDAVKAFKSSKPNSVSCLEFPKEVLPQIWELFEESFSSISEEYPVRMEDFPNGIYNTQGYCKFGYIGFNHNRPPTEEEKEIVVRIANEFGRVYQRFLDLQKAEAQAREAQIEVALERVRAASMAMHKTGEISEVVTVLFDQLNHLNVPFLQIWITILNLDKDYFDIWFSPLEGVYETTQYFTMPSMYFEDTAIKTWRSKAPFSYRSLKSVAEVDEFINACDAITGSTYFSHGRKIKNYNQLEFIEARHEYGFISKSNTEPPTETEANILKRFAKVFEQAYTRFLDIEKAEAQARESQIEAALERVRARTMAMHNTEDIAATVTTFFNELLGLHPDSSLRCGIGILSQAEHMELWTASVKDGSETVLHAGTLDMTLHPLLKGAKDNWRKKGKSFSYTLKGKDLKKYFHILNEAPDYPAHFDLDALPKAVYHNSFVFRDGFLFVFTESPLMGEIQTVLERFAAVFGQTYTRYLDLQKAEAQARESQIQLSLERVRARSLAMQSTDELHDVLGVLFRQFDDLGIQPVNVFLSLFDREQRTLTYRASGKSGKRMPGKQVVEVDSMEALRALYDKWLTDNSDSVEVIFFPKEVLSQLFGIFSETFSSMPKEDRMGPEDFPEGGYSMAGYTPFGYLGYDHQRPATDEEKEILTRFCVEFTRVYQRFLDIQKAEAQTREAQIEMALERVRSASMAMHKSKDLHDVLVMLYNQLASLGLKMHSAQILESIDDPKVMHIWVVTNGVVYPEQVHAPFSKNIFFKRFREAVTNGESFYTLKFSKHQKDNLFHHFFDNTILRNAPQARKDLIFSSPGIGTSNAMGKYTSLSVMRYDGILYSEEENEIIKRFAKVLEQSYTRFLDIKKAEAHAREAQIEAALERIRSKAMAMHSSDDLADTVEILYKELDTLQVHALRFGHAKLNSDTKIVELHTATDLGKVVGQIKLEGHPLLEKIFEHFLAKEDLYYALQGEEMKSYYAILGRAIDVPIPPKDTVQHGYFFFLKDTANYAWSDKALDEEELKVYRRLITVLNLTYKRYDELKNAETQAREAQIEAALEKVRSQSLAMHNTSEMQLVANAIYEQLHALGLDMEAVGMSGAIEAKEDYDVWVGGVPFGKALRIPYNEQTKIQRDYNKAIKDRPELFARTYSGKVKEEYINHLLTHGSFPAALKKKMKTSKAFSTSIAFARNSSIQILRYTNQPYSEEDNEILKRFSKVFEQAYIRFRDLERAEVQAREAQIESALERVRSRSLAMQKPDELQEVVAVVAEELKKLGVVLDVGGVVLCTYFDDSKDVIHWTASEDPKHPSVPFFLPYFEDTLFDEAWESKLQGDTYFAKDFSFEVKNAWFKKAFEISDYRNLPDDYKKQLLDSESHALAFAWAKNSAVMVPSLEGNLPSEAEKEILIRFARVFEQAYIRFMDLQKSEEQAREAKIEMALEKVRARTMAMHKSEELGEVAAVLFEQISTLTYAPERFNIAIGNKEEASFDIWVTDQNGHEVSKRFMFQVDKSPVVKEVFNAWGKERFIVQDLHGKKLQEWVGYMEEEIGLPFDKSRLSEHRYINSVFFSHGCIGITTNEPPETETLELIERFAKVFQQTYVRFLDLQKAEDQAREAQIEVALERVRSRAMAMHQSDELTEVLGVLFDQFDFLGINPVLTHLTLMDEENETFTLRISRGGNDRTIAEQRIDINAVESWKKSFENWKRSDLHAVDCIDYPPEILPYVWELMDEVMSALPEHQKIYPSDFPDGLYTTQGHCKYGYIGINQTRKATQEEKEIVIRFAKEFGRLYQRFLDLQQAEERAREALKQASLDRVRGQIASMRSTEDLERITPLIWNELTALGVPFIRCGVFIVDESNRTVQAFLSAPDGRSLGAMKIPFDADKDTAATVAHWKKGQVYRTHWDKGQFLEFMQTMMDLGQVSDNREYQGAEQPPDSLFLHFLPFTQGMLYVGNSESLDQEQMEAVGSLADAFAIAYARYEDFAKLEKTKKQVEKTLNELRATQDQLVQSEKMASLGELTAGIAHEIQNPLNFVNNFSEVSVELMEEMEEEMNKGDLEEVKAIMEDIKQNLDKINHHGKRADGIVKGMLQHSRASTGEKEPTDINVLADEYLRLAYHGLRAKDKSFNATLETQFDESLGKVRVVPQEIGRVILNLITNAFHVVKEKKEKAGEGYTPTVTVITRRKEKGVEISVKDNGNGIPEAIREKIFQPFFTTKPTGQGTGLGLSMSYDIVTKGHGGSLIVESDEGKGTTMIISLPIEKNSGS